MPPFSTAHAGVFISYSHQDRAYLERLRVFLRPLERAGRLALWDDTRIQPGQDWKAEIEQALDSAQVAVLLLSADFLASEFITTEELPRLERAARQDGLTVLYAVLKPCRVDARLERFQATHDLAQSVLGMSEMEREAFWCRLAEAIERALAAAPPRAGARPAREEVRWLVPYERNPFFTGRTALLAQLHRALQVHGKAALCGLGGIGKTQTVIQYAYQHQQDYRAVLWARADTDVTLTSDFVEIARGLGLPEWKDANQNSAISAVRAWLEQHERWLLICDNADQPERLRRFRPPNGPGHLLITSRSHFFHALGIPQPIELEVLAPEEAVQFLCARTGRSEAGGEERLAAADLCRELGYLPLALEQAGAYMTANQARIQDYLKSFRIRRLPLLSPPVAGEYPESVATTWAMNFAEVERPAPTAAAGASSPSADLLRLSAFLSPDNIPLEILIAGAGELGPAVAQALSGVDEDPVRLDETLEPLTRYSLIHRDIGQRTYSIHRIVQAVLKDGMEAATRRQWAERAVRAVQRAYPGVEYACWPLCDRLAPHVQACADEVATWQFSFEAAGRLLHQGGVYLRKRAQYAEAERMLGQALALRESAGEPAHPAVAATLNALGMNAYHWGEYAEAAARYERALQIAESPAAVPLEERLWSLYGLALVRVRQARPEAAEPLFARALALRATAGEAVQPDLPRLQNGLARLYRDQGRLAEAEALLRAALAAWEQRLGRQHPDVAWCLNNLGDLLCRQGRFADAEATLRTALATWEAAVGAENPNVAVSLYLLADLYQATARSEAAIPLYRRALGIRERALGAGHPDTRRCREALARLEQAREPDAPTGGDRPASEAGPTS